MSQNSSCAPQLIAWAYLPGTVDAPTGTIAQKSFGCVCNKTASKGNWLCSLNDPVSVTDGSAIIMTGPGVPSDSNSGVVLAIGDNGVGHFEITIRDVDGGLASDQPGSFMVWKLPVLT